MKWWEAPNRSGRTLKEEIKKQIPDQIAHWWWGFPTGAAPVVCWWGIPWWGASLVTLLAVGSVVAWVLRERAQRLDPEHPGSHVSWDPAMDNGFFYGGIAMGVIFGILIAVFVSLAKTS